MTKWPSCGQGPDYIFNESLLRSVFCSHLYGRTKDDVLSELVDVLVAAGCVSDRDGVLDAVRRREEQISTGMQFGIALPHGKHASVTELVSLIALHPAGVAFDSLDGIPCRIFVMTLSPLETVCPHQHFLAVIGRLLGRPAIRDAVLNAEDKAALIRALS